MIRYSDSGEGVQVFLNVLFAGFEWDSFNFDVESLNFWGFLNGWKVLFIVGRGEAAESILI